MVAIQKLSYSSVASIEWLHNNPVTQSQRSTTVGGSLGLIASELDPLGLDAGILPPPTPEDPPGGTGGEAPDVVFPRFGDIMNGSTGCTEKGMMISCDTAKSLVEMEAADVLPEGVSPTGVFRDYNTGGLYQRQWVDQNRERPENQDRDKDNDGYDDVTGAVIVHLDIDDNLGYWRNISVQPNSDSKDKGHLDDCNRFANAVRDIANSVGSVKEFLDELARQFAGSRDSGISSLMDVAAGGIIPQTFSSEGMKPVYGDGGNQPRHFIGAFMAVVHMGIPGEVYMNRREVHRSEDGQPANEKDQALNGVAARLAARFINEPLSPNLGAIRAEFAKTVRKELCLNPRN